MLRTLARDFVALSFATIAMALSAAPAAAQTTLMIATGGGTDQSGVQLNMFSFAVDGSSDNGGGIFKAGRNVMLLDEVTQVTVSGSQVTVSGDAKLNGTPIRFLGYFTDRGGSSDDYVVIRYSGYTWWQGNTDGDDIKIITFGQE